MHSYIHILPLFDDDNQVISFRYHQNNAWSTFSPFLMMTLIIQCLIFLTSSKSSWFTVLTRNLQWRASLPSLIIIWARYFFRCCVGFIVPSKCGIFGTRKKGWNYFIYHLLEKVLENPRWLNHSFSFQSPQIRRLVLHCCLGSVHPSPYFIVLLSQNVLFL